MMTKDKLRQLSEDERLGQMRESEYLGAEDIDGSVEPVLTIAALWNGAVTLQRGKENKDVLSFAEERVPGIYQVRPLIINSTNRKALRKLYGDAKASTLVGKQIQLYVDHNVRDPQDGGLTDGIRIRPFKPRAQAAAPIPPCADCGGEILPAMGKTAAYMAAYTNKHYGVALCAECAQKRKNAMETESSSDPVEANRSTDENTAQQDASEDSSAPAVDPDTGEVL